MKQYYLEEPSGYGNLMVRDLDTPAPKRGQALVRMRAASLNYRDLIIAAGRYRLAGEAGKGFVPLSDGAGEVVEVGDDVDRVQPGDRVVSTFVPDLVTGQSTADSLGRLRGYPKDGVLAEYAVFDAQDLVPLPDELDYRTGSCLPCAGVTAWNSLFCGPKPLLPGQVVLVLGTGGVSVFAIQLAHAAGAAVITTSSSDDKLARARELGSWQGINYLTHPEWQEEVLRLTGGAGADHTVENGGPGTMAKSIAATRFGGSMGMIGVLTQGEVNPITIMHRGMVMRSVLTGSRTMLEDLARAFAFRRLQAAIDRVFPFPDAVAAYRHLESAGHVGKVVIEID